MNTPQNTPAPGGGLPAGNAGDSNSAAAADAKTGNLTGAENKADTANKEDVTTATPVESGPPIAPTKSADGDDATVITVNPVTEVQLVESENDNVTELPLAPLPKAGYRISKFILYIISGYLLFLAIFLSFKSFDASEKIVIPSQEISDSSFAHQKELIQALQQEKKDYREFIMQISQMVLLNLLLPTLTAVLGYIFGSREEALARKSS